MIKKVLPWLLIVPLSIVLIIGYAMKDNMNDYVSELIQQQASSEITDSGKALVDSLYNYAVSDASFEFTLLEFGAKSCSACQRMEKVLDEVRVNYPDRVNVEFYNILKTESQNLMKMYGIAAIPTQIILDKNGHELFRHTGYISFEEVSTQFKTKTY